MNPTILITVVILILSLVIAWLAAIHEKQNRHRQMIKNNRLSIRMQVELNNHPARINLNPKYKDYINKAVYPWRLVISIPFKKPLTSGWPTISDKNKISELETRFEGLLQKVCSCHYMASIDCCGACQLIYYVDRPDEASDRLVKLEADGKTRPFAFSLKKEPEWETVAHLWLIL